ncbi:hypothetical protein V490_06152 [Pseudogymnoascus sp. VKM F-3557]|nr:hypothetical protein V490_06152 [Pseudogymnoascus sp. VKM F-3557]
MGKRKAPYGPWGEWKYNTEEGVYIRSRINRYGDKQRQKFRPEVPPQDGDPQPVSQQQDGVIESMGEMRLSTDDPEPEGEEVSAQEGHMLQLSTSPLATNAAPLSYPEGQYHHYYSGNNVAQYNNAAPNVPLPNGYNPGHGRGQSLQGARYSSVNYGVGNVPGTAMPQSNGRTSDYGRGQNQPTTWHGSSNALGSFLGNSVTQSYGNTTQPANSNIRGPPPIKRSRKGSNAYRSLEYQVVHSDEFKARRVFMVVWTEPRGNSGGARGGNSNLTKVTEAKYGELAYTSIRRFVVWKNHEGHALCLPILTYGGQGTTKPGVKPAHHAIIFTESKSEKPPRTIKHPPCKAEGEHTLHNGPICVELMNQHKRKQFDEMSRLNYAKVYTVEHNVKVCFIGRIHKESTEEFKAAYGRVQRDTDSPVGSITDDLLYEGAAREANEEENAEEEGDIHPDNKIYGY